MLANRGMVARISRQRRRLVRYLAPCFLYIPIRNQISYHLSFLWAEVSVYTIGDGDPDGDFWLPNECDTVIRDHFWFWNTYSEDRLKSLDHLMDIYYKSVGYSSVLLLNVAPDRSGRMPEADVKRAAEFGDEINRRFGNSIAHTKGESDNIELELDKPTIIDHVITMEEIRNGERVREYVIEGLVGDNWQRIAEGTAIGHKKIDRFKPVKTSSVRLRVTKSVATPIIRMLAVYNTATEVSADQTPSLLGYDMVWTWNPESLETQWARIELDLSPYIDEPRQYDLLFKKTGGENELEVESAILVLSGVEIPGFAEPLDSPNSFNINITATPSRKADSIKLRARIRGKGGTDTHGKVLIRKVPIQ